ncbi:hypothetical protein TNCV_2833461 [Trichonephila clavipes]|nr:hypothetical protein TNCV_2833461 [Trichonephila clavipes]
MSAYEPNSRHLREVLIFCFNMKKSAAEAHRMLSNTYGSVRELLNLNSYNGDVPVRHRALNSIKRSSLTILTSVLLEMTVKSMV